jgi:hypothetical protein
MSVVREAVPDDIPAMLAMAERFIALAWGRVGVPYNPDTCEKLIRSLIANPSGIVLVDDNCTAMLGAVVHCWHFNEEALTATELFWWAEPSSNASKALWEAAEAMAFEKGALTFNMACQHHMRAAALGRVYEGRGYTASEHIYIRELQ